MQMLNVPAHSVFRKTPASLALSGVVAAILMGASFGAQAQTTDAAAAPADPTIVVVTAQKRKENIREVPLSISVLSADKLEKQHVQDYADLARTVPGLSFVNTGNSGNSRITLRGVGSAAGAATVGVYLNDVSLTIPNQYFTGVTLPRLFDLDHVEVLRGPQGTLYGDSSLGGTMRFITNQPRLNRFGGYLSVDGSSTSGGGNNGALEGAVNLPIGDKMALRLAGQSEYMSGYVDHVDADGNIDNKNVNSERTNAFRATLLIQPDDTLKIIPAIQWQETHSADTGIFDTSLPKFEESKAIRESGVDTMYTPSLTVEKSFGGYTLTSVTSFMYRQLKRQFDATIYDSEYVASALDPDYGDNYETVAALPGVFYNTDTVQNWSQELRFSSPSIKASGKRYEWQVGAYYNYLRTRTLDDEYVLGINNTVESLYGSSVEDMLGYTAPNDQMGYFHPRRWLTQAAVFAEGAYMLTPKLKATLGVRQAFAWNTFRSEEGGWLADGTPSVDTAKSHASPTTPKVALTYLANDNVNLYASAAKGYRLGGQNDALPNFCASAITGLGLTVSGSRSYSPDSLWAYEVGAKTQWLNHRLTVNGSLYSIDWDNIQQQLRLASCGYVITANAGNAKSQGGELEINARLSDSFTLSVSGSLTDAHITKEAAGSSATVGQKVLGVPDKSLMIGLDYNTPLGDDKSLFASVNWNYTGESHGTFDTTSTDYVRPSYSVVNASLGIAKDDLTLSLYVKNLLDDRTIIQQPSVLFITQGLSVWPRTVGMSLNKKF
ncbi:MAG: TonB-dependent receptor [Asticcacaulis sp.]|uniref:TonB-dependent receptor n=1 Tax=Asticcacaulis sp. TaxID=1872648 RepID=UPI0039E6A700